MTYNDYVKRWRRRYGDDTKQMLTENQFYFELRRLRLMLDGKMQCYPGQWRTQMHQLFWEDGAGDAVTTKLAVE